MPNVSLAQDAAADELLGRDPRALLIGMLLDQPMRQRSSGVAPRGTAGTAVLGCRVG